MNVAIYGKKVTKQNSQVFEEILKHLKDFGWNPVIESELKHQLESKIGLTPKTDIFTTHKDFHKGIDLTISIGGDGTFIKSVSFIRDSGVPILGVNTGRLGFLSNISQDALLHTLEQVVSSTMMPSTPHIMNMVLRNKIHPIFLGVRIL